jgi:hydroxymethylbilane synthase
MTVGTRGSALARVQAHHVADVLTAKLQTVMDIAIIHTQGDRVIDRPLRELEGRGYFTKEIEEALLAGEVDIAVHSFKDMPSKSPEGLELAAISVREDPADLLLIRPEAYDESVGEIPVKAEAIVGTSAVRRESQLRAMRPDVKSKDLRGNVPTRVSKIAVGQYDAIFLASAGVRRLGLDLSAFKVVRLDPTRFVPSPGQGALAIQMRTGDREFHAVRRAMHDETTATATAIERGVQAKFGGGCGLPLGVYAEMVDGIWHAHGFWSDENTGPVWAHVNGGSPEALVDELYAALSRSQA